MSSTRKVLEDEVLFLRSQNELLKSALGAIKDTATAKLSKSYELVWYARNRSKSSSILSNFIIVLTENNNKVCISYCQLVSQPMMPPSGLTIQKSTKATSKNSAALMETSTMASTAECLLHLACLENTQTWISALCMKQRSRTKKKSRTV